MAVPTITLVSPSYGPRAGGDSIVITGTNFTGATAVKFGTTNATSYTVDGATQITAVSPYAAVDQVHIYVTNADGTNTAATADLFEHVGLFSLAEARAFDKKQLANASTYSDDDITAAEERIREDFEQICSVAFIPTKRTDEYYDGTGTSELLLDHIKPISVTSCIIYDSSQSVSETFDADDLTDLGLVSSGLIVRRSHGSFLSGRRNIKITSTNGYATVPPAIKRAALILAVNELVQSNIGDRTTSFSDGNMTFSLATAGRTNQWYGIPLVDSALQRYNHSVPGVA